jgi:deoxyribonuclease-4
MADNPSTPASQRLIGAHMPTAGGIKNALTGGKQIGCTAVQVFTGNPRQWQHPPMEQATADVFREAWQQSGIAFTCAHDSYLINLAAPDPEILEKSRRAFRRELDRAEMLGIPWVVTHMGAHLTSSEDEALDLLCESMNLLLEETEQMSAGVALETTAGQGTCLGAKFEHIARVIDGCANHPRVGVCLDTCHIFAAGYDIRDDEAYSQTFDDFGSTIGFDKLKIIHANDAKKPLGSRVDRHEHIGDGEIGIAAFRRLVADPRMLHAPVIVETPEADSMHAVNVDRLRRLAQEGCSPMRVTVRLFGHYSDVAHTLEVEAPAGATVSDIALCLVRQDARLAGIDRCRAAVNEEYCDSAAMVREEDEVAFIPPMSGG